MHYKRLFLSFYTNYLHLRKQYGLSTKIKTFNGSPTCRIKKLTRFNTIDLELDSELEGFMRERENLLGNQNSNYKRRTYSYRQITNFSFLLYCLSEIIESIFKIYKRNSTVFSGQVSFYLKPNSKPKN